MRRKEHAGSSESSQGYLLPFPCLATTVNEYLPPPQLHEAQGNYEVSAEGGVGNPERRLRKEVLKSDQGSRTSSSSGD